MLGLLDSGFTSDQASFDGLIHHQVQLSGYGVILTGLRQAAGQLGCTGRPELTAFRCFS